MLGCKGKIESLTRYNDYNTTLYSCNIRLNIFWFRVTEYKKIYWVVWRSIIVKTVTTFTSFQAREVTSLTPFLTSWRVPFKWNWGSWNKTLLVNTNVRELIINPRGTKISGWERWIWRIAKDNLKISAKLEKMHWLQTFAPS